MSYFKLKNGEQLYYEDIGSGEETVVMMHGWTSSSKIYKKPAEILKDKARFIIYDHRGHSGSMAANSENVTLETLASDLNELITGLGLEKIILLGWSMGAAVAMNYVKIYGCSTIKQLILCDMTPKVINDDEWKLGLQLHQGPYTKEVMEADKGNSLFYIFKPFAVSTIPSLKKIPNFLLDKILKKQLVVCDENIVSDLSISMGAQDNRTIIGEITVPLTYFYPEPGSIFSPELAKWYQENCKTEFHAVKFSGTHMFIPDHPKAFAKELAKIL